MPIGVDDVFIDLDNGLLHYADEEGQTTTLQFVDDATCHGDSDAWRFLVLPALDSERLFREGTLCDFRSSVAVATPSAANQETVLATLDQASQLCS